MKVTKFLKKDMILVKVLHALLKKKKNPKNTEAVKWGIKVSKSTSSFHLLEVILTVLNFLHISVEIFNLCCGSSSHKITYIVDFFFFFFFLFKGAPMAYGGSQARGRIGATNGGLRHSHSNLGSELRLQPTPQFTEMPFP